MKITSAQINPTIGNIAGNAAQILKAAEFAVTQNCQLLLTPELSLCGYPPRDLLLNPGYIKAMEQELHLLASKLTITTLVGVATVNPQWEVKGEKSLYNTTALLQDGVVKKLFHKRLLPTYDVFDEDRYFAPGNASDFFILEGVKVGVTICEDLWNDENFWGKKSYQVNPISELVDLGIDLLVNLSASPFTINKQRLREKMLSHAASHYRLPVIYTNQVGGNDDLIFDGGSVAINPQGTVVARANAFKEDLLVVEWDGQDLSSSHTKPLPNTTEEEVWQALVLGVKDYAQKCGFSKVVLGLSGGVDSAIVATIAKEALGAENVLGVLMPSPYSSDHSITDAIALVKNLGIHSQTIPIGQAMRVYDQLLDPLFSGTDFGVAEENIQSRIRGNLLMAIANKFAYLLLSTGNKSEMAVGYCTLYGDMNGGLAVIADVPKTLVYSLCLWLNRNKEVIPSNVITKPPSAELKPGQVDQDSLPPYDVLDDILYRLINLHQSSIQIVEAGYPAQTVAKVLQLVARAEFKRKQAPPGLKISDRAFGTGWRMPIAARWYINT